MTLNDLVRRNTPYFAPFAPNLIALQADYVTVVEDRLIMSAKYRLPVTFGQNLFTQQSHGLFAIAKLLVSSCHISFFMCIMPGWLLEASGHRQFNIDSFCGDILYIRVSRP